MRALLMVLALGLLLSACEGTIIFISTGPSPVNASAVHIDGGPIVIGQPVTGVLTRPGSGVDYRLVPPRNGTLVLGVSWDRACGLLNVLFASSMLPRPAAAPPFSARLPVQAGQTYTIVISDATMINGDTLNVPFVVTAAME